MSSSTCLRNLIKTIHLTRSANFHRHLCSSSLSNQSETPIITNSTLWSPISNDPDTSRPASSSSSSPSALMTDKFDSSLDINLDPFNEKIDPEALRLFVPAPRPTFNFAALANREPIIGHLIHLGVDLAELEQDRQKAEFIMTLNFEQDVQPYLRFLQKTGIPFDRLGQFLTSNIDLLRESLQNLEIRIEYLRRKKFTDQQIVDILLRFPAYLNVPVLTVDAQLAYYQQQLDLKAIQVREMLIRFPRMVRLHHMHLQEIQFALKEEMGFSAQLMKQILIKRPGLMRRDRKELVPRFNYLHDVIEATHAQIAQHPEALGCRVKFLRERHEYLKQIGRAQYDGRKPCYIPLQAFTVQPDSEFVRLYCHTSEQDYDAFLKIM